MARTYGPVYSHCSLIPRQAIMFAGYSMFLDHTRSDEALVIVSITGAEAQRMADRDQAEAASWAALCSDICSTCGALPESCVCYADLDVGYRRKEMDDTLIFSAEDLSFSSRLIVRGGRSSDHEITFGSSPKAHTPKVFNTSDV